VQEGAPGSAGPIDNLLGQHLEIVAIIRLWVADDIDKSRPAAANAYYLIAFTRRPNRHGADRRVESWDITTAC
jgi:hypothetical protein